MPSLIDSLAKNIFQKATVTYQQQIAPHVYHIRVQSDAFRDYDYIPGEHLRLFVGIDRDTGLSSKLRTYSIWAHDSSRGTLDIAACTHSSGPGALWAAGAKPGDTIHYMGPKGKLTIDYTADSALMICDSSALSHMYAISRHMDVNKKAIGIVYAPDTADCFADIDGRRPFHHIQLTDDPTEQLIQKATSLRESLSGKVVIYIGGDARVCRELSRFFRGNWPDTTVMSRGFWMPGKVGMD